MWILSHFSLLFMVKCQIMFLTLFLQTDVLKATLATDAVIGTTVRLVTFTRKLVTTWLDF